MLNRIDILHRVEDALRAAELTAVRSAEPTLHAGEFITRAHGSGRRVVVVSNNSEEAVRKYLAGQNLAVYVHDVVGRAYANPLQMKPNPAPLMAAFHDLDCAPADCVLIGDSTSDIDAAKAAGTPVIGYANKAGKREILHRADALIDSIAELISNAPLACILNTKWCCKDV